MLIRLLKQMFNSLLPRQHTAAADLRREALTAKSVSDFESAETLLRAALTIEPSWVSPWIDLSALLLHKGNIAEATACCNRALELDSDCAEAWDTLGTMLHQRGSLQEASDAFEKARSLAHDKPEKLLLFYLHSIDHLLDSWRVSEYDQLITEASERFPENAQFAAARLVRLNYDETLSPEGLANAYREWSRRYFPVAKVTATFPHGRREKISIAYVGTFLHYMFMRSYLRFHDFDQFDVHIYTDDTRFDLASLDRRIRVHPLKGDHLLAACRETGTDIAIDLVSPWARSLVEIDAFRKRTAPVQCAWVGTLNTTGNSAYDYLIADHEIIAPVDEALYIETPARLPNTYLCYLPPPPTAAPDPGPLPARKNGYITFASFARGFKITPATIDTWAKIVGRCPGSRLLLKGSHCCDPVFRKLVAEIFHRNNLQPDRCIFVTASSFVDYLRTYRDVDICLDTYPFNGNITTLEALWMGVPMVSRSGRTLVSRFSRTYLACLGYREWYANTEAEYIDRACALAEDWSALEAIRARLRGDLLASPVCDGRQFAMDLENLLRSMAQTITNK